jgi:hypothetical protein
MALKGYVLAPQGPAVTFSQQNKGIDPTALGAAWRQTQNEKLSEIQVAEGEASDREREAFTMQLQHLRPPAVTAA